MENSQETGSEERLRFAALVYHSVVLVAFIIGLYGLFSLFSLASAEIHQSVHIVSPLN